MIYALCLNWNGENLLKKMIPGLIENLSNTNHEYKILVRDNGSKDNSVLFLKELNIDVLEAGHNRDSFSKGVNSLFKIANPKDDDLILLINNDIIFNDSISLKNMISCMNESKSAICGARLMFDDGSISHNGVIFSKKYNNMPWHFRAHKKPENTDYNNRYFQAVTAACMFIKAKNFKKASGLDEDYNWAFEDIDLNLNVSINQKEKVICCGKTNITHLTSNTLNKNPVHKMFLSKNVRIFKNKWMNKYMIDHDFYEEDQSYMLA